MQNAPSPFTFLDNVGITRTNSVACCSENHFTPHYDVVDDQHSDAVERAVFNLLHHHLLHDSNNSLFVKAVPAKTFFLTQ